MLSRTGLLYVVATPIGNLSDMTLRAIEVLKQVDVIAAEDTRHSKKLLLHYQIHTPMQAFHDHNEQQQSEKVIDSLLKGQNWALISDAGTPLINDPGYTLVKLAHKHGISVIPIPGASSVTAALSVSGLPTDKFFYQGFLPAQSNERLKRLKELQFFPYTLVFLESCHRIMNTLEDCKKVFGETRIATLAHELTKLYESIIHDSLDNICQILSSQTSMQQGEFVLLIKGEDQVILPEVEANAIETLQILIQDGLSVKQSVKLAHSITGFNKNMLYKKALELKERP